MTITKKDRVDSLKALKTLANSYLSFYKNLNKQKTKSWIHVKTENSILQLKEIINSINKDLHPQKIELYCKAIPTLEGIKLGDILSNEKSKERAILNEYFAEHMEQTNLNFVLFELIRFAPEQNIIHDITWLTDGVTNDYIDIALGKKNIQYFECYLPSKIHDTEELLIPYFKKINGFSEKIKIIKEAIKHSKKKDFLISNILLITVTESIVRETCKFIYQKQNPSYSKEKVEEFIHTKFNSLDTLISKAKWEKDYSIKLLEAVSLYKDVTEETINNCRTKLNKHVKANKKIKQIVNVFAETLKVASISDEEFLRKKTADYLKSLKELIPDLLSDEDLQIKINISVMFNFLIRKYKDDRNLIIHGNFEAFNHKWKNYINYSALLKVFDTYKNYSDLYSK